MDTQKNSMWIYKALCGTTTSKFPPLHHEKITFPMRHHNSFLCDDSDDIEKQERISNLEEITNLF